MRVLTFSWEYPPVVEGGLGRHVQGLSEQLVARGIDVHVVSRGPQPVEDRAGVVVHRVPLPPFPRDLDAFLAWVAELNEAMGELADTLATEESFDLVHSHDWLVADAARASARALRRPWLVTVHATEHGRHRGWVRDHPQSAIHAIERTMAREADLLITCSRYMARHVAAVFAVPPERITALRNGINLAALSPGERNHRDRGAWRARLAPGGERLVLLAGRLVHEKGFQLALEALAGVIETRADVRFVVAGTGTAEAELRRRARELGLEPHGRFLGWVQDETLHALYQAADVCLVPSLFEPFGIVALEAMACGCPVVVADTGGLRELVPDGGRVGVRVPREDPAALAAALARLLDDEPLRGRMAAAGREHARGYDWAEVAQATHALYAQLSAVVPAGA